MDTEQAKPAANNMAMVLGVAVIIVALIIGWWFMMQSKNAMNNDQQTNATTTTEDPVATEMKKQGTSDDVASIEADAKATNRRVEH